MVVHNADLQPGDVIVTMTPDLVGWSIRLRSWLRRRPDLHNHVAMFTHTDDEGIPRGLEGRPSGFGWCNLSKYLEHPSTVANWRQPERTEAQRLAVVTAAQAMLRIPYDWAGILAFAASTAGLPFLAREWPDEGVPSHVVCSSALDYLYEAVGWDNPGGFRRTRGTDPADWTRFILAGDTADWSHYLN